MAITLIGYRGSGKSTVAPRLAEALGWDWIDADIELERRAGKTIRAIFDADGEPAFRQWECDVLADLLDRDRLVIAAGGGAVLRDDNRARMARSGPVVWLKADVETLFERIHRDPTTAGRRPNLTSLGEREEVERLLAVREPLYRAAAALVVEAGRRPVADIVAEIVRGLSLPSGNAASTAGGTPA